MTGAASVYVSEAKRPDMSVSNAHGQSGLSGLISAEVVLGSNHCAEAAANPSLLP